MPLFTRVLHVVAFTTVAQDISWVDPCTADNRDAVPLDHSVFGDVLAANVVEGTANGITTGLVDYESIQSDPSMLRNYLLQLCDVDLDSLTPVARLALLCNAYNALMIALVIAYGPQTSVRDVAGVWELDIGTVAGRRVSLDYVEHTWIRGGLSEEVGVQGRAHAGLVCASLSCPDIYPFAFEAAAVVEQLTVATRNWLANPSKNRGPDAGGVVSLSKIYEWYGGDFSAESGSIHNYLRSFGPSSWEVVDSMEIRFLDYNWELNKQPNTSHTHVSNHARQRGGQFVSVAWSAAAWSAMAVIASTSAQPW